MSSSTYITGGIDPASYPPPPGLNGLLTSSTTNSNPHTLYITGGYCQSSRSTRFPSIRTRSPKPYKPSLTSSGTLTPTMATTETSATVNGNGAIASETSNGSANSVQQLAQGMQPESPRSPTCSEGSMQSRPTTADSSLNGHSSAATSNINTTPGQIRLRPPRPDAGQPLWTHRLSASFNAMAAQVEAASQAISLIPPFISSDGPNAELLARIEALETSQARIEESMEELRRMMTNGNGVNEGVKEIPKGDATNEGSSETVGREEIDLEALKKTVDDLIAKNKTEQQRMPARLHNSIVTTSKGLIKPVVFWNGKVPPQFPSTRGEFFHLTKERYEVLLKGYGLPVTGDLNAKRTAVREFIGLPE